MKNIGIFAGTFDPIHKGHIAFSMAAKEVCKLDAVYLMAERNPRSKQQVSDISSRESLLKHAVTPIKGLEFLSLNDDQFSVKETFSKLQKQFPDSRLTFLIGSDVACNSLLYWDNLEVLLPYVNFAIGIRDTHEKHHVEAAMQLLTDTYGSVHYDMINSPHASLSSTKIRQEKQKDPT